VSTEFDRLLEIIRNVAMSARPFGRFDIFDVFNTFNAVRFNRFNF
jgi:hypothetical protein